MNDDLRAAVEEALSLSHEILPQTIDDVIAIVREHDAPLIEARVREARADAWDEGYAKGFYRAQTIHNDDPDRERDASEFDDPNPFDGEVRRG